MRRLLLALMIAISLLAAASPAQAQQRADTTKCQTHDWHTYIGLEAPINHWRWGDLITSMHTCYNTRTDAVIHTKTEVHMQIVPNGVSDSFGTNWAVYGPTKSTQTDYRDERYFMGTFRNCEGVGSFRVCGPTGHFTVVLTYQSPTGSCNCADFNQYRRAGEPNKAPDDFDNKIRFYDTP